MNKRKQRKRIKKQFLSELGFIEYLINKDTERNGVKVKAESFQIETNYRSICYFNINQLPEWRFAFYLYLDNSFKLIGEHKYLIDKFRPGRDLSIEVSDFESFSNLVNIIRLGEKDFIRPTVYSEKFININEYVSREKEEERKLNTLNRDVWNFIYKKLASLQDENKAYHIEDQNGKGYTVSPRWIIKCTYDYTEPTLEEIDKDFQEVRKVRELIENHPYHDVAYRMDRFAQHYVNEPIIDWNCIYGRYNS